jgi:hypothetical protein
MTEATVWREAFGRLCAPKLDLTGSELSRAPLCHNFLKHLNLLKYGDKQGSCTGQAAQGPHRTIVGNMNSEFPEVFRKI